MKGEKKALLIALSHAWACWIGRIFTETLLGKQEAENEDNNLV